jgi:hydrogenase maturation protease
VVGKIVRSWRSLDGSVEVRGASVQDEVFKLTVKIINTAPWSGQDRDSTLKHTFVSTHTMLTAEVGMFVSLMDPPEVLRTAAEACVNIKTWPVLVGDRGQTRAILSSPIILYDYPQVAPESPGDLFDGTEIDQLLLLNILTLTDDEKEEMRASDPRAREILARTEALDPSDFMRLHGTIRECQQLRHDDQDIALWDSLERPTPQRVTVCGHDIEKGSRVRLRPRPGGDIFDLALDGKTAVVETIEQDYDDRVHVTVTLEDDPGRDLAGIKPGHRFFFRPEEVEPLKDDEGKS